MTFTDTIYKCGKCNEDIYLDEKKTTKSGRCIPMDPGTRKYHVCKSTVHKRKGMLRVCTKTQMGYYWLLGIYPGATVAEIEDAYQRRIQEWHPDTNKSPNADKWYKKIIEAHNNIRLIYVRDE
jgi:DnaJ domain